MILGETIDSFSTCFPRPALDRDQVGILAVSVRNLPDASLGMPGYRATDLVVMFFPPDADGQPDRAHPVAMGDGIPFVLEPTQSKQVFRAFDVRAVNPAVSVITLAYEITGTNEDGRKIIRGQAMQLDLRAAPA